MKSAEEAAGAQHQLSMLEVKRNQFEEQLGRAGRAHAQLLHRFHLFLVVVEELEKE